MGTIVTMPGIIIVLRTRRKSDVLARELHPREGVAGGRGGERPRDDPDRRDQRAVEEPAPDVGVEDRAVGVEGDVLGPEAACLSVSSWFASRLVLSEVVDRKDERARTSPARRAIRTT